MTSRFPSPKFQQENGIASCFGNVPLLIFNLWVQNRPAASTKAFRAQLATALTRSADSADPVAGILRLDWLPKGWEPLVEEAGLTPAMTMTAMDCDNLLPARRRAPANLDIRRVGTDESARDLAALNALAYGMRPEEYDCMASAAWWPPDWHAYVGYVKGKAVSTASVLPVNGTVYVALVATRPEAQGKGYASAVVRHAVEQGHRAMGVTRTTLHASEKGEPMYRAMGYRAGSKLILTAAPTQ